jgi:prepilin-type N-terminal cleavage/methylation domain-containing protein
MLQRKKGFTIIELLVVIAIIGLLAGVILASMNNARIKARDSQLKSALAQVSKGLALYYDAHGYYPNVTPVGAGPWTDNYESMIDILIAEKFLGGRPKIPSDRSVSYMNNYWFSTAGGLLVSQLLGEPASTGYPGSCRPFALSTNWCDPSVSNTYCVCSPL